jgi:hypothetical protein
MSVSEEESVWRLELEIRRAKEAKRVGGVESGTQELRKTKSRE